MRRAAYLFAALMILIVSPAATFAGAPTTLVVVNGPGLPPEGVKIKGAWPGWITFVDFDSGAVAEPASDVPRYTLTGYTDQQQKWYTVLYVWDRSSGRAVVYVPPGVPEMDIGFPSSDGTIDWAYRRLAGKWYAVRNRGAYSGWAELIRKALPQAAHSWARD